MVIAIGFINFFAFIAHVGLLGGDALNGHQSDGRFYISNHGRVTEVSEEDWRRNRLHGISVFLTHPLCMAAMLFLAIKDKLPKMVYRGQSEEREKREKEIRASGLPKVNFSCGGKIGSLDFGGPLLEVTVYPQGIHFKPILMPSFGVLTSEIKKVNVRNSLLKRGVEIVHTSSVVVSPIFLNCPCDNATVSALTSLET